MKSNQSRTALELCAVATTPLIIRVFWNRVKLVISAVNEALNMQSNPAGILCGSNNNVSQPNSRYRIDIN